MATYNYTGNSNNNTISPGQNYTDYYINGGAGIDTLYIDASKSSFTISPMDSNGVITISGASAGNKKLFLTNIEKVAFKTGGTVDLPTVADLPSVVNGTSGNDNLTGTNGNNTVNGDLGIDTFSVSGLNYLPSMLTKSGDSWTLSSTSTGTDTLSSVERIQFADKKIALDVSVTGNAGMTLEFINTIAHPLVHDAGIIGLILPLFDQGNSLTEVFQLAINIGLVQSLAGSSSNEDLVKLAYRNVVGIEASAADASNLAGYIQGTGNGTMTQAEFLSTIAVIAYDQLPVNVIGQVQLQNGVEYIG